jgi:hypothetical protein
LEFTFDCGRFITFITSKLSSGFDFETIYNMMLDDGAKLVHSQSDQSSDLATFETFIELPEGHFGLIALPAVGEGLRVDNPINEVQQNN